MYDAEKCIGCMRCVEACPQACHQNKDGQHVFERKACIACGKCAQAHCGALELFGYEASAEYIIEQVMKDKPFYDHSGGGLTLSGGEPLFQPDFCLELLKAAKKKGLHTCMETCGFASTGIITATMDYVDLYLFDYKETDPKKHLIFTGVSNEVILQNLRLLDRLGKQSILRCPIIPGYNDTEEHFQGIASTANALKNCLAIDIEPYNSLGESKYSRLARSYQLQGKRFPEDAQVASWMEKIGKMTSVTVRKSGGL